jgi:hypothetical protein
MVLRAVPANDKLVPGFTDWRALLASVPTRVEADKPLNVIPAKVGLEVV